MLEKDIEKILVGGVHKLGGKAFKWVSPGNGGVPDRIVILPEMPPIFVELKTETGQLSVLQNAQIRRLRDMGQNVKVLYGEMQVRDFLEDCELRLTLKTFWKGRQPSEEEERG